MEDAVKAIPDSSDLCQKIVLGHNVDDIPGTCRSTRFLLSRVSFIVLDCDPSGSLSSSFLAFYC